MDIFQSLKKAFSTGLLVSSIPDEKVTVIDTQRAQAYSKRGSNFFSKLRKGLVYNTSLSQNYTINRLALYRDYDMMDTDPIVSAVLDVYVFQAFTKNQVGQILTIKSEDQNIVQLLTDLFYNRLHCQFNFPIWFRTFLKYGDFFLALKLQQQLGIYDSSPICSYDIDRIEDPNSDKFSFKLSSMAGYQIDNYNVAHFRNMMDPNFLPYGRSILQPARRLWKNFNLMVDAMLIQRIMRAPERRIFKVDVGDLSPEETNIYMTDLINKMKKVPYRDPKSGQLNLRYNMMNLLQDYYIPVRGNADGSTIDTLPGMENVFTDDIQFIKSYMLAAFKVPKAFLTFQQGLQGKSTLSQLDIIFGRAVQQYQNMFTNGLNWIALIHLYMNGYTDIDLVSFKLQLNNPSVVKQVQDIDLWTQKVQLGQRMKDTQQFGSQFVYRYIYKMSDTEISQNRLSLFKDKLFNTKIQQLKDSDIKNIKKLEKFIDQIYYKVDVVDNILDRLDDQDNPKSDEDPDDPPEVTPPDGDKSKQTDESDQPNSEVTPASKEPNEQTPQKDDQTDKKPQTASDDEQSEPQQEQTDEQTVKPKPGKKVKISKKQPDSQSQQQEQLQGESSQAEFNPPVDYKQQYELIDPFEKQQQQIQSKVKQRKKKMIKLRSKGNQKQQKVPKTIKNSGMSNDTLTVDSNPMRDKYRDGGPLGNR